jgi:hypothetical protein
MQAISHLDLLLFTADPALARRAESAGIDALIVDWESKGKKERQAGHDMEIGIDTPDDLAQVATAVSCPVTVRINALGPYTEEEIELALSLGARGLMLPMARSAGEVREFLGILRGRARTIVQIETQQLVEDVEQLGLLPWDAAYVGLHDLMLSRGAQSMWDAVLDGTVEHVFRNLGGRTVGFAGVTVIGGGDPIPFTLILQELARLGAGMSFLRRSFRRELADRNLGCEVMAIRSAWTAARARGPSAVERDRLAFMSELQRLSGNRMSCVSS